MRTAPWRQRWQQWQSLRPKLHRDGASLPATLLLASLQQQLDSEQLRVVDLQLQPEECVLELDIQQPLRARLQLFFHFGELDWPRRTLLIHYRLQGTPQDNGLIRRAQVDAHLAHLLHLQGMRWSLTLQLRNIGRPLCFPATLSHW